MKHVAMAALAVLPNMVTTAVPATNVIEAKRVSSWERVAAAAAAAASSSSSSSSQQQPAAAAAAATGNSRPKRP